MSKLELIKSVLFAIQGLWSSHFILTKFILKNVQFVLSRFLLKGLLCYLVVLKLLGRRLPYSFLKGELGIGSLDDWNRALILF